MLSEYLWVENKENREKVWRESILSDLERGEVKTRNGFDPRAESHSNNTA